MTDGRRTLSIQAVDSRGLSSNLMYIVTNILVMDRNDGPDVNLGTYVVIIIILCDRLNEKDIRCMGLILHSIPSAYFFLL